MSSYTWPCNNKNNPSRRRCMSCMHCSKTTCYMTMDYSLSSFQHFWHFRHFLDFQDFGPRRCTIALSLFKIFGFLENATKRLKTTCYMTMDYSLSSFQHFLDFLDFQDFRCTIALCLFQIFRFF